MLSVTAKKFGQSPSKMLGIQDETIALDFNIAAAARLILEGASDSDDEFEEELEDVPLRRSKNNRDTVTYY